MKKLELNNMLPLYVPKILPLYNSKLTESITKLAQNILKVK